MFYWSEVSKRLVHAIEGEVKRKPAACRTDRRNSIGHLSDARIHADKCLNSMQMFRSRFNPVCSSTTSPQRSAAAPRADRLRFPLIK